MKIKVVMQEAEEGGNWAKVPTIPGCTTEGETFIGVAYESLRGRGLLLVR